jgi:serine protease
VPTAPAIAGGPIGASPPASVAAAVGDATDRLIVKLRDPGERDPDRRIAEIGARAGERLVRRRAMSGGSHVVQLSRALAPDEARALARRLALDAAVASAEPDLRMFPQAVPNDAYYAYQWSLFEPAGGINAPAAWDLSVGASSVAVAVIDTGIRPHADLAGRLGVGYDFIADVATANDGDGRDADASDPGDYGCNGSASSWHGTHVAGIIGAVANNGAGVVGVNWRSTIVSARALGRCGGYTSDIVDAMRWASGIAVAGVAANANPARVLNLSLGGAGPCGTAFQNAVNDVTARGTVVVVAAGNGNADASGTAPANCSGVIAVAATTRSGGKASYSNYGATVAIAAPGGGGSDGILSTLNSGTTTPGADSYAWYQGTSMATPHVSGVVSLMLSLDPSLTPAQVAAKLRSSARAFPTGTGADCTSALCGAGIVDAAAALAGSAPVTPPPVTGRLNFAAAANGGVASASSSYSASFPATAVNNGDRRGAGWGFGGGWADATPSSWPDWLQIDFATTRTVAEIDVFSMQDDWQNPPDPTETMTFTQRGLTDFEVQVWTGSTWQTVPGGSVTGNNKVWRKFTFAPVATPSIRVLATGGIGGYSRLAEVEAYEVADTTPALVNHALQGNGGVAYATSSWSSDFPVAAVNNGDRRGSGWGFGGGWADATQDVWPDTVQINFNGAKSISEIDVFSIQDAWNAPQEPTESLTFTRFGIIDFDIEYWNGSAWLAVPGGNVNGNDKVWRRFSFPAVTTTAIHVVVRRGVNGFSRLAEIEAYGSP